MQTKREEHGQMAKDMVEEMNDKEILKVARAERGVTQVVLADKLGMLQHSLSANMTRQRMSLGMFTKILEALDFDVVVVDRETGDIRWKVEVEE